MSLETQYLGLQLKNPLVAGASPLSRDVDRVRFLEDQGLSAVVLYSLFEEQITHESDSFDHFEDHGTHSFAEASTFLPMVDEFPRGPDEYVEHVRAVKKAVDIPVIASLNGSTLGGWTRYASLIQEAGADALELNIYHIATDPAVTSADVETRYIDILEAIKKEITIPVSVKLAPYFSSLPNFVQRLEKHGADGLVLFNRFYQPDIDLEALEVIPDLSLSTPHEMRLPLRWIAVIDPLVKMSLAASTGVYDHTSVLKLLMVGADVVMLCAALLRGGTRAVGDIKSEMIRWLEEHEYESVAQLQGSMNQRSCSDPEAFERANYMRALFSYS
jgi:dihydroorotate dehydrogenase (fumarate)